MDGVRKDIDYLNAQELYDNVIRTHYDPEMELEKRGKLKRFVDVKQALGDLPIVFPGQDVSTDAFDYPCDNDFLKRRKNDEEISSSASGVVPIFVFHELSNTFRVRTPNLANVLYTSEM